MIQVYIAREDSENSASKCKGFAYATVEAPAVAIEKFKEKYQGIDPSKVPGLFHLPDVDSRQFLLVGCQSCWGAPSSKLLV